MYTSQTHPKSSEIFPGSYVKVNELEKKKGISVRSRRLVLTALVFGGFAAFQTTATAQDPASVPVARDAEAVFNTTSLLVGGAAQTFNGVGITSVIAAVPTAGLPSYSLVPGAIALPYPLVALQGGTRGQAVVQLQTTTYSGPVTAFYALTQNGIILSSGRIQFSGPAPQNVEGYARFNFNVPMSLGQATLTGTIVASGRFSTMSIPITIQ